MSKIILIQGRFAQPGGTLGSVSHKFTIDEIPGGRSDQPLDLGALTLKLRE